MLRLRSLATWIGLAMMVMACPPFAWAIDVIFFASFALWLFMPNHGTDGRMRLGWRIGCSMPLFVLLLVLPAIEFFHRMKPEIAGTLSDHLVVIGDSISAGINPHVVPWPSVMQQTTGVRVKNLARPGAGVKDGISMAEQITADDRVILIEIGGNDLLGGTSSLDFEVGLNEMLEKVAESGRTVAMFELPLLPNRVAYGQIQRRLAAKYGVWLIPKRYLVDVIRPRDATTDGLHLSAIGARHMAVLVSEMLRPVLKIPNHLS